MLDALGRLFAEQTTADPATLHAVLAAAHAAAEPLLAEADGVAVEVFVAEVFTGLLIEENKDATALAAVLDPVQRVSGVSSVRIALRALDSPALLALPLEPVMDVALGLLEALAPLSDPSLWLRSIDGAPRIMRSRGDAPALSAAVAAGQALTADGPAASPPFAATVVRCWLQPHAALVWRPERGAGPCCAALAERCASLLGVAFERASLIEGNVSRSQALVRAAERRLTRLGFDLHDGPMQDVMLLAGGLDELRGELERTLRDAPELTSLKRRFEDLSAVVEFIDADLRELANSLDGPTAARRRFDEALHSAVRLFSARSGIEPQVTLTGDLESCSDSQRIALLRIVQEALSNVREHSDATQVRINVEASSTHVTAIIEDDGCGFHVEHALHDAARRGRMGLLGMMERVRLLGGGCNISSRPGEGTSISLTITRWTQAMADLVRVQ